MQLSPSCARRTQARMHESPGSETQSRRFTAGRSGKSQLAPRGRRAALSMQAYHASRHSPVSSSFRLFKATRSGFEALRQRAPVSARSFMLESRLCGMLWCASCHDAKQPRCAGSEPISQLIHSVYPVSERAPALASTGRGTVPDLSIGSAARNTKGGDVARYLLDNQRTANVQWRARPFRATLTCARTLDPPRSRIAIKQMTAIKDK